MTDSHRERYLLVSFDAAVRLLLHRVCRRRDERRIPTPNVTVIVVSTQHFEESVEVGWARPVWVVGGNDVGGGLEAGKPVGVGDHECDDALRARDLPS